MNNIQFTLGADPEIFVKKRGKPFSAHGLVPGSKESPHKTDVGAIQVDGLALEFNIDPVPLQDFDAFNFNIVKTIAALRKAAGKGINFNIASVQEFDEEYLKEQPEEALELGCDPDWDAYTQAINPRPKSDGVAYRTGAGHVHIGWGVDIPIDNPEHIEICSDFIKTLDATVGLFMTCIDRDPRRRELYGKAGAFRPKPYGVEYRTPSNLWIKSRDRRKIMHRLLVKAIGYQKTGRSVESFTGRTPEEIQRIINEGDWKTAKDILQTLIIWQYASESTLFSKIVQQMERQNNDE